MFSFGQPASTPVTQTPLAVAPVTVPTSTLQPPTAISSALKNKSISDIANKWNNELEIYLKEFQKQASQLSKWDESLRDNGTLISSLYKDLERVEALEVDLNQDLDYIESQQNELETLLEGYSTHIQTLVEQDKQKSVGRYRATAADEDREKAYTLAEHLNTKLDDMTTSLTLVITEFNASKKGQNGLAGQESPLDSITQILNSHLTCLEWIERQNGKLEAQVEGLKQKQASVVLKSERFKSFLNVGRIFKTLDSSRQFWDICVSSDFNGLWIYLTDLIQFYLVSKIWSIRRKSNGVV